MSGIGALALSVGGAIGGELANQAGYGLGNLTGYNQSLRNDQIKQQQALTNMQYSANYDLMKKSYEEQMDMWNETNYEAQIKHLKNAGLNPALLYAKGGQGGTTGSGGTSVSGGTASNTAQEKQAQNANTLAGMGMMKLQSEIKLNEAQAAKLNAEAKTTEETRSGIVEKLRQEGHGAWLENLKTEYTLNPQGEIVYRNKATGKTVGISETGLFNKEITADIAKTIAEGKLTDNKAIGYFQELLNDTARANATGIQAAAAKLAAEFNFGDLYNTKWWIQTGQMVVDDIFKGVGVGSIGKGKTTNTISTGPKGTTHTTTTIK